MWKPFKMWVFNSPMRNQASYGVTFTLFQKLNSPFLTQWNFIQKFQYIWKQMWRFFCGTGGIGYKNLQEVITVRKSMCHLVELKENEVMSDSYRLKVAIYSLRNVKMMRRTSRPGNAVVLVDFNKTFWTIFLFFFVSWVSVFSKLRKLWLTTIHEIPGWTSLAPLKGSRVYHIWFIKRIFFACSQLQCKRTLDFPDNAGREPYEQICFPLHSVNVPCYPLQSNCSIFLHCINFWQWDLQMSNFGYVKNFICMIV